ncbi:hypothetical protein CHM_8g3755 [Cryptosporidium hominis]
MKKLNITDIYVIMLHRYTVCSVASSKLLGPMLKFEMRKSFLLVVTNCSNGPPLIDYITNSKSIKHSKILIGNRSSNGLISKVCPLSL